MKRHKRGAKGAKVEYVYLKKTQLMPLIRQAVRSGLGEAIEHCSNFWQVTDGYKEYISRRVAEESEILRAVIKSALQEELPRKRAHPKK